MNENKVGRLAQNVDEVSGAVEAVVVSVAGRLATWVAPIPIATLTARSIAQVYDLPMWAAVLSSIALELIGVTTSQRWINAREWNAKKKESDPRENEGWPLAMLLFYFFTDCAIIAAIEVPVIWAGNLAHLISILFPLMGAIGIVVLAMRVSSQRMRAEVWQSKEDARQKRAETRQKRASERKREAAARKAWANLGPARVTVEWFAVNPTATHAEAAKVLGIARRTVGTHLDSAEEKGVIRRNGKGVEVLCDLLA